jgi:DNA-binding MarR family transcriptional regulator
MGVAQTSLWAYESQLKQLGEKQFKVYETLKHLGMANNQEVADYLGWPINKVTGRMSELNYKGLVYMEQIAKNSAGIRVKYWSVKDFGDDKLERMSRNFDKSM